MLENEYIENLVDKFTNIINEANDVKNLYITLGQRYAEGEESKDSITNWPEVNHVQDLEDELNRINNMTYSLYAEMVNGAPTEDEFQEWKNARVEALQNRIEQEKVNRDEDFAHMENDMYNHIQNNMDAASDEYDKAVDELKKHVEKINTQIERTIKRIQIRIEELDEEIADIVDELRGTNDHDEKIRLSKELENYRAMKVSYENNLAAINEIRALPNEISNSVEDYDKVEGLLKTATEKASEINGRLSMAANEIEVNISYNEKTGKYIVSCRCGNLMFPGKEFSEEELSKDNISKLLKGFAGAIASNRVVLSKNGKVVMKTSFENAASNIVDVSKNMDKTIGGVIEEDKPSFNPLFGSHTYPKYQPELDQPELDQPELDQPELDQPELDQPEPDQPELDQPELDQPELDQPELDQPELDQPELDQPELDQPELDQPELDQPELDQPELDQPELDQPELDQPELDQPELDQPELDQPELDQPELDQPELDQPELDQPELDQPELDQPELDQPELDQPELDQPELDQDKDKDQDVKADPVVYKVIKTRNFKKGGLSGILGFGAATTVAIAAVPALGIPLAAVSAVAGGLTAGSVTSLLTDAAANYKSNKIRKSLSKLAKKHGLIVKVDREGKSVYFCSNDDLSTRISLNDLKNPNPDVRATAQALQTELSEMFDNNERGTASKEAMEKYAESGSLTSKVPLEYCQKVTLDNLEAAYQEVGGVYGLHNEDRKKVAIGKKTITTPFLDPNKVSINFAQSIEPEEKTQSESVDMEDVLEFVEDQANQGNAEQGGDAEPTQEEAEPQPASSSQGQSTDNDNTKEDTPSSNATQDVDTIDDAQSLANALDGFMSGINVSQTMESNSQNIHNANMMGALNGDDLSEGKGMSK